MGLNIIIYQALLYVSIILLVALIVSYISHKTRKPKNHNMLNYFRTPHNHMKSIQRDIHAHEMTQMQNSQFSESKFQNGIRKQAVNIESGQNQVASNPRYENHNINYIPNYHQVPTTRYYPTGGSPQLHRNAVYFK